MDTNIAFKQQVRINNTAVVDSILTLKILATDKTCIDVDVGQRYGA